MVIYTEFIFTIDLPGVYQIIVDMYPYNNVIYEVTANAS